MHRLKSNRQADAFTMVEMLVVMAIIGILAALLLPALAGGKQRAKRITCESQLGQIGLAFQSFSHDHNSKFPMQVSTNDGGSQEYDGALNAGFEHFKPLAGLLQNPNVLVCPADTRLPATDFATLQNSNLSYFVGVNADYDQPMSVLAGDGNLAASSALVHGPAGGRLTWNRELHVYQGNVLFADGHVEEWSDNGGGVLASSGDMILPADGVGGGGGNGGGGSGGRQPGQSAGQGVGGGGVNSMTAMNGEAAQAPAAVNQSSPPPQTAGQPATLPMTSSTHKNANANATARAGGSGPMDIANSVAGDVADTTNPPAARISNPRSDDSTMSPVNRQIARVLRDFMAGTYLLILLLLLAYVTYRVWRSRQDPIRKRRRKLAQRAAQFDPES